MTSASVYSDNGDQESVSSVNTHYTHYNIYNRLVLSILMSSLSMTLIGQFMPISPMKNIFHWGSFLKLSYSVNETPFITLR